VWCVCGVCVYVYVWCVCGVCLCGVCMCMCGVCVYVCCVCVNVCGAWCVCGVWWLCGVCMCVWGVWCVCICVWGVWCVCGVCVCVYIQHVWSWLRTDNPQFCQPWRYQSISHNNRLTMLVGLRPRESLRVTATRHSSGRTYCRLSNTIMAHRKQHANCGTCAS
jgi:hypothetical protein